jgi:hypothetical protein
MTQWMIAGGNKLMWMMKQFYLILYVLLILFNNRRIRQTRQIFLLWNCYMNFNMLKIFMMMMIIFTLSSNLMRNSLIFLLAYSSLQPRIMNIIWYMLKWFFINYCLAWNHKWRIYCCNNQWMDSTMSFLYYLLFNY